MTVDTPAPVFALAAGRGRTCKSTVLAWGIGRALNAGREVEAADGDRSNQTLSSIYRTAARPPSADDADMRDWLTERLNRMATENRSLVVDFAAGDRFLHDYGRDLALVEFCEEIGVQPLVFLCMGPSLDDFAHVLAVREVFPARRAVLVLNEALVPQGMSAEKAFEPIRQRKEWKALRDEGAVPVLMPKLAAMGDVVRRRLDFWAAASGAKGSDGTPLGPVQRVQTSQWIRRMEEAFAPAASWLP